MKMENVSVNLVLVVKIVLLLFVPIIATPMENVLTISASVILIMKEWIAVLKNAKRDATQVLALMESVFAHLASLGGIVNYLGV